MKNNLRSKKEHFINTLPLENQLELILSTPWEKRHELIVASEQAGELVASMPVEELFWTIKATGIEDSAPILNLTTPEQLQFIFDLDFWKKAELRPDKIAAWFLIMLELSRENFQIWLKWILNKDHCLFPAIFNEFLTVIKRPDDMDIQEAKDKLPPFTLDNVYYISFKKQKLAPLFANLITHILEISDGYYRDIFETMLWETPSANLETAYRFRCGRIGDFGIPDYYESLDIYTPLELGQLHRIDLQTSPIAKLPVNLDLPAFVPTLYLSDYPTLAPAIQELAGQPFMERIIREITGVANKILMVDMPDLDDPSQLRSALKKAFCLINLGIEYLEREFKKNAKEILATYFIEEIVRSCNKFLIPLGQRARNLINDKGFWALPHDLKPIITEASKRPPHIFIQEGTSRPVMTLKDIQELEKIVSISELWREILYFFTPPFETWKGMFDWRKTNVVSPEEFSVDIALSTALSNVIVNTKFEIRPIDKNTLKRLKNKLESISGNNQLIELINELLQPMLSAFPKEKISPKAKQEVLNTVKESFLEIIEANRQSLENPRFIKGILTIL